MEERTDVKHKDVHPHWVCRRAMMIKRSDAWGCWMNINLTVISFFMHLKQIN